jgi:hypothetical protein
MAKLNLGRALLAGIVGTAAMTMLMLVAPLMGMPRMSIGDMLGGFLHIGSAAGWAMHGVIGLVLAVIYSAWFAARLPGGPVLRGAIYGFGVFLVAQLMVTPMMGGGVFSGGQMAIIVGSLMGHLVYGALVGALYGSGAKASNVVHA